MSTVLFHLSHNDLDGYGSSYVASKLLKENYHNINYYNVNYPEVNNTFNSILASIEKVQAMFKKTSCEFHITDLGITEEILNNLKNVPKNVKIIYTDHHIVSEDNKIKIEELLKTRNNIIFNINKDYCATKLYYDYIYENNFSKLNMFKDDITLELHYFVENIDIYDRWLRERQSLINHISFVSDIVFKNPLFFQENKTKFIFGYFDKLLEKNLFSNVLKEKIQNNLLVENNIQEMELSYFNYIRSYASNVEGLLEPFPTEQKIILSEIDLFEKIILENIKKDKSGETYSCVSLPSNNFQYLSAQLLSKKPDIVGALININFNNGTMSYRSNKNKALYFASKMDGGGHENASGSRTLGLKSFKEIDIILKKVVKKNNLENNIMEKIC